MFCSELPGGLGGKRHGEGSVPVSFSSLWILPGVQIAVQAGTQGEAAGAGMPPWSGPSDSDGPGEPQAAVELGARGG